jgi:YYY domain-containing protein
MQDPGTAVWFQVEGASVPEREKPLTFDQPVGNLPVVDDARWSASVTDNSVVALLVWIVLLVALQAITWPLVRQIFTRFPDRGWSFARLITLLIAGFGVWFLASIEIIAFRAIWAGVALLITAGISVLLGRAIRREQDNKPIAKNAVIVTAEVVFWSVFALFLFFRLINPDSWHPVWGGEKPMEFAHLNAILRSAHFPPVDPWYSGGYINYYYYGTYLVAFLIKLTGIPTEIAFNLAQPTFVALLAMSAFGLAAALGRRLTDSTPGSILTGLFGVFFVSFASNFIVAERVVDLFFNGLGTVNNFSYWVFNPTRAIPDPDSLINITEFPYFAGLYADLHPHVIAMPITILMIALAWQLVSQWRLVLVVTRGLSTHRREAGSLGITLLLLSLGLGSIFITNAWDLPMYAAVTAVGVVMATQGIRSLPRRLLLSGVTLGTVGALAYLLILPFTQHYVALFGEIDTVRDRSPLLAIESHVGGQLLLITVGIAALMASRQRMRLLADPTAPLALLGAFLLLRWYGVETASESLIRFADIGTVLVVVAVWLLATWHAINHQAEFGLHPIFLRTELVHIAGLVIVLLALDRTVLALYAGIGLAAILLWLSLQRPSERFVAAMIAGATLLGGALELVFLVDDLAGTQWYRMNTIFKFYNQVWVLLGIATAAVIGPAIWQIFTVPQSAPEATEKSEPARDERHALSRSTGWSIAALGLTGVVIIASLAYPVVATPIRLDQHFPQEGRELTLDAFQWMEYGQIQFTNGEWVGYADDLAAIDWFNEHVDGTPVIAEASFGTYRCNGSRFSIATGLPAVIGWQRHEQQQRYLDDLSPREQDLRDLYTTIDVEQKRTIIDRYDIQYIVVGQTERNYPMISGNDCIDTEPEPGIEALESMVGSTVEVAFTHGTTTVYRVISG